MQQQCTILENSIRIALNSGAPPIVPINSDSGCSKWSSFYLFHFHSINIYGGLRFSEIAVVQLIMTIVGILL